MEIKCGFQNEMFDINSIAFFFEFYCFCEKEFSLFRMYNIGSFLFFF